jgi:peptidyl-prolyl cis-trans isomerase C
MLRKSCAVLAAAALALPGVPARAQTAPAAPPAPPATAPALPANAVAATVNGQPIPESAVQRGLQRVAPARRAEARTEILNYLIENELVEQYLKQMQIAVDPKDVDKKLDDIRAEITKKGNQWEAWLQRMQLSEAELKQHITADMRWDKYAGGVANDKVLRELFDAEKDRFDGTLVRARHILLKPRTADPKDVEAVKAQLRSVKEQVEGKAAEEVAKLPPTTDPLARKKAALAAAEKEFGAVAAKVSECPSKEQGGDVEYFPRGGEMVEPFSKAAFSMQVGQISDVVQTTFGYHLILVTERKESEREVKFDEAKGYVREVYCDRLRESMVTQARPKSRIEITPLPKP